jgi:hypothetical protein
MRKVSKMSFSCEERRPGWPSELLERASEEVTKDGKTGYNNRSDPHDEEPAINGASADIGAIEAAYHDGVVAGVASMGLVAPVRPEHGNVECHRAFQAGLAAGIKERRQMIMRLFVSGVLS